VDSSPNDATTTLKVFYGPHQQMEQRMEQQRMADEWQAQRQDEQRYEQQQQMRRWAAPHHEEPRSYLLPSR
jgi:hypothetical protein